MLRAREPTSPGGFRWLRIEPVVTVVSVVRDHLNCPYPCLLSSSPKIFLSSRTELIVENGRGVYSIENSLEIEGSRNRNGMGLPSCRRWAMGRYWWFLDSRRRLLTLKVLVVRVCGLR